jgi:hypothetical protein
MSIGSLGGVVGSAAGAPLSQTKGSETERTQKESTARQREVDATQRADLASGIGQTEQDQEASERDADGRRLWEIGSVPAKAADSATEPRQSKDATGNTGTRLDLTG